MDLLEAFCNNCHAVIKLQEVRLDGASDCPRCGGEATIEPLRVIHLNEAGVEVGQSPV